MTDNQPAIASTPSSTGLAPNIAGALAYLLGPITGILFLVLEKKSSFVRYHAAQSIGIAVGWIALAVTLTIISTILGVIPVIGFLAAILMFLVSVVLSLAGFALWIFLMYQAYEGREWEFPWIGAQSRRVLLSQSSES